MRSSNQNRFWRATFCTSTMLFAVTLALTPPPIGPNLLVCNVKSVAVSFASSDFDRTSSPWNKMGIINLVNVQARRKGLNWKKLQQTFFEAPQMAKTNKRTNKRTNKHWPVNLVLYVCVFVYYDVPITSHNLHTSTGCLGLDKMILAMIIIIHFASEKRRQIAPQTTL